MPTRAPVPTSRRWHLARRLGAVALALPLLLWLAVNGLISSGLLSRLLSQNPQWLVLEWRQAWMGWPGSVEVRDFHLRAQDRHIQWELTIDRASADIDLGALLHRTFRTRSLAASGVELRWRPALSPSDSTPARVFGRPPITGVPEGAELCPSPPEPEPDTWALRLQGVTVEDVREVWVGAFRVPMDARVTHGEVWLFPGQFVRLANSRLEITRAEVFRGPVPLAHRLFGSLECALVIEDWDEIFGLRPLRHLDAALQVEGRLNPLDALGLELPAGLALGGASLDLTADVEQGLLVPGSRLTLGGDEAVASLPPFTLRGLWRAEGIVEDVAGAVRSRLALAVRPLRLDDAAGAPLVESPGFTATLDAAGLALGHALPPALLQLALEPTAPFSLPPLAAALDTTAVTVTRGEGTVGGRLTLGPGAPDPAGRVEARAVGLRAELGGLHLEGSFEAGVDLRRLHLGAGTIDLAGSTLAMTQVAFLAPHAQPPGWSGQVTLVQAELSAGPPVRADVELAGHFTDARPFLALLGAQPGAPTGLLSLVQARNLRTHAWVALRGERLVVERLLAVAEGLKLDARLEVTARDVTGVVLVSAGPFEVGLRLAGGKVEAHVLDGARWFQAQLTASQ